MVERKKVYLCGEGDLQEQILYSVPSERQDHQPHYEASETKEAIWLQK